SGPALPATARAGLNDPRSSPTSDDIALWVIAFLRDRLSKEMIGQENAGAHARQDDLDRHVARIPDRPAPELQRRIAENHLDAALVRLLLLHHGDAQLARGTIDAQDANVARQADCRRDEE